MIDFRIADIAEVDRAKIAPLRDQVLRPNSGYTPQQLTIWDPLSNQGQLSFAWDVSGSGWNQGYWAGRWEWLYAMLYEDLTLTVGTGPLAYARASTSTRANSAGGTDALAADEAPFDWLAGPAGRNRYCYRSIEADAQLTIPVARNLRRKVGGISFWARQTWTAAASGEANFIKWGSSRLYKGNLSSNLTWQLLLEDATTPSVTAGIGSWTANTWHLIMVAWARGSHIGISVDGANFTYTSITKRLEQFNDTMNFGQLTGAGSQANAYLIDLRFWPVEPTNQLAANLFALKA